MNQLVTNNTIPKSIGTAINLSTDYVITRGTKAQSIRLQYVIEGFDVDYLVEIIRTQFASKWLRIEEAITFEYLVMQAGGKVVDITVNKQDTISNDRKTTGNIRLEGNNIDTEKANMMIRTTDESTDSLYGFNSTVPVPSDTDNNVRLVEGSANDNTVSRDSNRNSTQDNNESVIENNSMLSDKSSNYTEKKETDDYQEWIEKEIRLRRYVLREEIFKDLDTVLTSSIYD